MEAFYRDAETADIHDELVRYAIDNYGCKTEQDLKNKLRKITKS
jgi:hypothetical protein